MDGDDRLVGEKFGDPQKKKTDGIEKAKLKQERIKRLASVGIRIPQRKIALPQNASHEGENGGSPHVGIMLKGASRIPKQLSKAVKLDADTQSPGQNLGR